MNSASRQINLIYDFVTETGAISKSLEWSNTSISAFKFVKLKLFIVI